MSARPSIFCVLASYGKPEWESARIFLTKSAKDINAKLITTKTGGSLLANAFNCAWCMALNMQEDGEPITHFCMLHDDVVPDEFFLNILFDDIQKYQCDVLSAVVPIKDSCGLTSTAIDDPDDPYNVERRLTMNEVYRLPEVFSAADCGYPDRYLLTNTGCWICDFTKDWRHKICFTINDSIHRGKNGKWVADVASEDWNFARDVQKLGGKVLATRRVGLSHVGSIPYSNRQPWGEWKCDKNLQFKFKDKTVGDQLNPFMINDNDKLRYSEEMPDVVGWLADEEGRCLAGLAEGGNVLEIGSYCGRSSIWIARTAKSLDCVDPFSCWVGGVIQDSEEEFLANITKYKVEHKIKHHVGVSEDMLPLFRPQSFDMVFLDAQHDYASVQQDIKLSLPLLKPDGILVFHDYGHYKEVNMSVDQLIEKGAEMVGIARTIAVVRPVKGQMVKLSPSMQTALIRKDDPFTVSKELPDVSGWLTDEEGQALAKWSEGGNVLEIGSYCGRSSIWIARTAKRLMCIDPFVFTTEDTSFNTLEEFESNIERYGVADKIDIREGNSSYWLPALDNKQFDLIFIDGDHNYNTVKNDILFSLPLLKQDGMLVFHDYSGRENPGVTKAVDEILGNEGAFLARVDSLILVDPRATLQQIREGKVTNTTEIIGDLR